MSDERVRDVSPGRAWARRLAPAAVIATGLFGCGSELELGPAAIDAGIAAGETDSGVASEQRDGSAAARDLPAYERLPVAPPPEGHGFTVRDLGPAGALAGRMAVSANGVLLQGGGLDIGGSADSGVFAYRLVVGDGEIVAVPRSVQRAAAGSTAGIMVRGSPTDPGAPSVFFGLLADPLMGGQYVYRRAAGEVSVAGAPDPQVRNQFLRVRREGRRFTLARSSDRVAWVKVAVVEIDMPAEAAFGLALCARSPTAATLGEFPYVRVLAADATAPREAWDLEPLGVGGPLASAALAGDKLSLSAVGDGFTTTWENGAALLAPRSAEGGSLALTARVDTLGGPGTPGARLALTFREGSPARLSSTSRNILISVTAAGLLEFQKRDRSTNFDPGMTRAGLTFPVWLRLTRSEDPATGRTVVTGSYSSDGALWTTLDSAEFAIPDPSMTGVLFTSGSLTSYARAEVSGFALTAPAPALPAPDAGAGDGARAEGGI